MTQLSHADAHERLTDLALEPRMLDRLAGLAAADVGQPGQDGQPGDALAAHVRSCARCADDLATWLHTHRAVLDAIGHPGDEVRLADLIDDEPIAAPGSLRAAVQRIPIDPGLADRTTADSSLPVPAAGRTIARSWFGRRSRSVSGGRLLQLVAVLATVMVVGGLLIDRAVTIDRARAETAELAAMTATLDRVIRDPGHRVVELRGADGDVGGSVSWSSRDLVVLTTALAEPPQAMTYRCWIEADGRRSAIGVMVFVGGTGYWTGSAGAWAATSFGYGATFGISLEPVAGGTSGPAILSADLGA